MDGKKQTDNLYLDIVINANPSLGGKLTPAIYDENLTNPLIEDPSKYYASIIRFACPLDAVPQVIAPIDSTQNNPNVTQLIIGIQTAGLVNFPQRVIYVPANTLTAPIPNGSAPFFNDMQLADQYYFIYSITAFLNMINTALSTAYTASALGGTAPFYFYNPQTQLISLQVTAGFIGFGCKIFMNPYTLNYLNSFNLFRESKYYSPSPIGFDYYHILNPLPPNAPIGGPYVYQEDFVSITLWFEIRKLLVISNSLPITKELIPQQNVSGITASIPIVTDFAIIFDNANQASQEVIYNPSAQYRLIDLTSNSSLSRMNFSFSWQDKFGTIYPLQLSPLQSCSLKFAIFKKELYRK